MANGIVPRARAWRRAAWAGVALLGVAGLYWGAKGAFERRFHPAPQQLHFAQPRSSADAMHQDLQALAQLVALDRSFSPQAAAQFERERAALDARVAQLAPEDFEMQVSRLVALAGNGHTGVVARSLRIGLVPLRFAWFAEGLFVTRAKDPYVPLLGSEVVAIDGKPVRELAAALQPYLSGTADHARALDPLLLQSPAALKGIGAARDANSAGYTVRKPSGELVTVTIRAEPPDGHPDFTEPWRNYAPQTRGGAAPTWHALLANRADLPLVLREPDASLYVRKLDGGHALYAHIGTVLPDDRGSLERQLAAVMDAIEPGSLRFAVLDLRFDSGGNYMETLDFTKQLASRIAPGGPLFIVTDRSTFSAAIVTLARAKYFAGSRAVVIGEHVGDAERFWAESGAMLVLPNSKTMVSFATGYHDWEHGCGWKDLATCFWFNFAYDVPAGSLAPQHEVAWRFADYLRGADTAMDEVSRRAHSGGA